MLIRFPGAVLLICCSAACVQLAALAVLLRSTLYNHSMPYPLSSLLHCGTTLPVVPILLNRFTPDSRSHHNNFCSTVLLCGSCATANTHAPRSYHCTVAQLCC